MDNALNRPEAKAAIEETKKKVAEGAKDIQRETKESAQDVRRAARAK